MQTFLPYERFATSARCLDRQRLGKQRGEVLQILSTLAYGNRWGNHPAVLMWKGAERSLIYYGATICDEWINRGYKDTCREKIVAFLQVFPSVERHWWLGDNRFHASHRAALLAKNYQHYKQFGWKEAPKIDYFWPTKN